MGTPLQQERFCVLETNHALSAVFSRDCETCPHRGYGYNYNISETFYGQTKNRTIALDDGMVLDGFMARDHMCFSMYGN